MVSPNDVLFIRQDNDKMFFDIREKGYEITEAFPCNNRGINFIRNLCFKHKIGKPEWWFNKKLIRCNKKVIIVYDARINLTFLNWLQNNNKETRIILVYLNIVRDSLPKELLPNMIECWTMDYEDSKRYNMNFFFGGYLNMPIENYSVEKKYDIFFIGTDKGRKRQIRLLEETAHSMGISTFIYMVSDNRVIRQFYHPFIEYDKVLKLVLKSNALLEIIQEGQSGVTFRTWESLFYEIKLITNNLKIKDYDFYNQQNIFILGQDNINTLKDFLRTPYIKVDSRITQKYTFEAFMEKI